MDKDKAIKEIKQLKELLDSGILTQNEYDAKSADLKKIILDSENKKNEPSESKKEKEFWEQKAIEKSNAEKEIIPPKKEEKKTNKKIIDKEKIVLKETTIDLSMDIDSDEQKNDERNKIIITDKEQTNTFLSIVLIFPSLILFKVREESLGESMNYAFEKFLGLHSKQPLTVNVSKPNSFLKIKNKDSLCIDISYLDFLASLRPESIEYS